MRAAVAPERFSSYQRRLFVFLSAASFFEGYDFIALTQILPNFRAAMGVGKDTIGDMLALINLGTVVAFAFIRSADRFGRKSVLTATIAGYTTMTFLSGLAPTPWAFAVCQMLARIFLVTEYVTSMIVISEEFPATRRGTAIGVVAAFSSFGAIVCAGLVPLLLESRYGWRTVYLVAIIPLLGVAYARRGLKETRRFTETVAEPSARSFFHVWRTPHRKRVVELGVVWCVAYIATQNTVTFFKDFAVNERGLSDKQVGLSIGVAALVALPLVFYVGKMLDSLGRRPAAAIVFTAGAIGTWCSYTVAGQGLLTVSLVFGIFSASAFLPVLNAFSTELFPTDMRADGFAWANSLLGRIGYVLSPIVVGHLAVRFGWGPVIRTLAIFPLMGIGLVYWLFPETKGMSLEETSAL